MIPSGEKGKVSKRKWNKKKKTESGPGMLLPARFLLKLSARFRQKWKSMEQRSVTNGRIVFKRSPNEGNSSWIIPFHFKLCWHRPSSTTHLHNSIETFCYGLLNSTARIARQKFRNGPVKRKPDEQRDGGAVFWLLTPRLTASATVNFLSIHSVFSFLPYKAISKSCHMRGFNVFKLTANPSAETCVRIRDPRPYSTAVL